MANGKKDNLDVKDRQILLGVATGLSFDNKIFAERLQQEIERLGRNGVSEQSIIDVITQDFNTKGRIFGEFRNSIKRRVTGGINQVFRREGEVGGKLRWVGMSKNICSDCLDRSGQVDTYDGWIARGLPSSGWSLCRDYCYCQLIPVDIETDDKIQL